MPTTLFLAAINGLLAVLLGAFGAHALETRVHVDLLDVWQTGVQYQMFHTVALIAVHALQREYPAQRGLAISTYLFVGGIALFCGSLYLMTLTGARWLGIITPIGGVLFLAGWLQLALICYRLRKA
jgi:uncharacterized membrane protein YgdD (TMEM256/DUF423 family)